MLQQDDVTLVDVVKSLSEQLQQVQQQFQLQLAEQQAVNAEQQATITEQQAINEEQKTVITEQARQIDVLTRNDAKKAQQVDRLTDNFARLEAEHKVIAALQDNGTGCCMSALIACRHFSSVLIPAMYI